MTYDLAAVGELMLDVVAPPLAPGRPLHAPIDVRAGGSPVNAARTAQRLGRAALVVGCVGDDALGRLVVEELAGEGLHGRISVVPGARTGRGVFAGPAAAAERGANAAFRARHLPRDVEARAVLLSGYQLLRDDSGAGTAEALRLGGLVGVDLGSARLVERCGRDRVHELLAGADVVLGPPDAIAAVGAVTGALVVETLGREGARAEGRHVRPPEVVDADLVGAGDAFAAAFLLACLDGASVEDALRAGCAAGALSPRPGATSR